jgi:hypothetical protein
MLVQPNMFQLKTVTVHNVKFVKKNVLPVHSNKY